MLDQNNYHRAELVDDVYDIETKAEYIKFLENNIGYFDSYLSEEFYSQGRELKFTNDNDIFDALQSYVGILETTHEEERKQTIEKINQLIKIYYDENPED